VALRKSPFIFGRSHQGRSHQRTPYERIALVVTLAALLGASSCGGSNGPNQSSAPGIQQSVFAQSVQGQYTQPDSIAVNAENVFVGYGDGNAPDGSDGKSNQIVEYTMSGEVVQIFTVVGHNDGLKIDPSTGLLWALQNEDANPNLAIIDPSNGNMTVYTFGPPPHGGGYDDLVFLNGQVYLSCSNPANNPNTGPAIVSVTLSGSQAIVTPVLAGNATATDVVSGATITLNLQDPDSMTSDPQGDLVLDSQGDDELIIVSNPGTESQTVKRLGLTTTSPPGAAVEVDDTIFLSATSGTVIVADRDGETVYALHSNLWTIGAALSAADLDGFVGGLNLSTGVLRSAATGFKSPHGMAFIPE
jgi:hypothetical protein